MEEVLLEILEWYKQRASPNSSRAYHCCPICNHTWWGKQTPDWVGEQHEFNCFVPRLQRAAQQIAVADLLSEPRCLCPADGLYPGCPVHGTRSR
jgi:hypothetical protein